VSDTTSDVPTGGPGAPPVNEEQAREYLRPLRSAPAEQLVSELLSGMLHAAQVQLGRKDARPSIDLSGLALQRARRYPSTELGKQVDQILAELRLGQVRAESAGSGGATTEPNDLAETPAPPDAAGQAATTPPTSAPPSAPAPGRPGTEGTAPGAARPSSAASRLWIPGRDF